MTDKIAIERETLERVLECLVQEGRSLRAAEVREALEQNAEPPAPKDPVAQWQKRHHRGTEGKWENTDEHDAKWWRASSSLWDIRALYAAPQAWRPDIGEVVVTRNDAGEIVAVTRQDDEGRILSVIAEAQPSPARELVAWKHDCAGLCANDVELWLDACPHCGKPRTTPPAQPADTGRGAGQHTPGPWHVDRSYEVGPISRDDDQSYGMIIGIADVYGPNKEADAHLIARAPEMLARIRELEAAQPAAQPVQRLSDARIAKVWDGAAVGNYFA